MNPDLGLRARVGRRDNIGFLQKISSRRDILPTLSASWWHSRDFVRVFETLTSDAV